MNFGTISISVPSTRTGSIPLWAITFQYQSRPPVLDLFHYGPLHFNISPVHPYWIYSIMGHYISISVPSTRTGSIPLWAITFQYQSRPPVLDLFHYGPLHFNISPVHPYWIYSIMGHYICLRFIDLLTETLTVVAIRVISSAYRRIYTFVPPMTHQHSLRHIFFYQAHNFLSNQVEKHK